LVKKSLNPNKRIHLKYQDFIIDFMNNVDEIKVRDEQEQELQIIYGASEMD
jgi:hypothetical protein